MQPDLDTAEQFVKSKRPRTEIHPDLKVLFQKCINLAE